MRGGKRLSRGEDFGSEDPILMEQRVRHPAKAAYQDFLTLWKDADPDIAILKEAKAEYAKLQ